METRDELSITMYLQCLLMSDATSLHHCLKNKQLKLNAFGDKDPAKGVLILCTLRGVWLLLAHD